MKLIYDCHTHTNYSHGKNTAMEMIESAFKKNLSGIHITEHGSWHHYAKRNKLDKEMYLRLRDEIESCKIKYPDMDIKFGVEANIISTDGEIDVFNNYDGVFDFINVGYHMMVVMKNLSSNVNIQARVIASSKLGMHFSDNKFSEICTATMLKTLDNYKINMITHPTRSYPMDMIKIAEKCSETDTLLEINNSKSLLNAEQVKRIISSNDTVMFAVGSDAHNANDVGNCDNAFKIIEESEISLDRVVNVKL